MIDALGQETCEQKALSIPQIPRDYSRKVLTLSVVVLPFQESQYHYSTPSKLLDRDA